MSRKLAVNADISRPVRPVPIPICKRRLRAKCVVRRFTVNFPLTVTGACLDPGPCSPQVARTRVRAYGAADLTRGRRLYACRRSVGIPGRPHKPDGAAARGPRVKPAVARATSSGFSGPGSLPFAPAERRLGLAVVGAVGERRPGRERPLGAALNPYRKFSLTSCRRAAAWKSASAVGGSTPVVGPLAVLVSALSPGCLYLS
jgi:hypothetical protein